MAQKQYIGARYVPLFDGEWNSAKAYEPLTVVTHLSSSYTSKKTVPAGTPVTNSEYWALTGTYNAQIEEYREIVQEVTDRVDELDASMFKTDGVRLKDKTAVFFGDSWTWGKSEGVQDLTHRFSTLVAKGLRMREKNYGVTGAGFTSVASSLIKSQIATAVSDMSETARKEVPIVFIIGGVNDLASSSFNSTNYKDGINTCMNNAHTAFPNALIVIGGWTTKCDGSGGKINVIEEAIRECGMNKTYPFLILRNLHNYISHTRSYYNSADLTHPSELGYAVLANYIISAVNGGSDVVYNLMGSIEWNSEWSGSVANFDGKCYNVNGICQLEPIVIASTCPTITTSRSSACGKVPSWFAPSNKVICNLIAGGSGNAIGVMEIAPSGNVYVYSLSGNITTGCYVSPTTWCLQ